HDEGGQEDRFEGHDQREGRPRAAFDEQHPHREQHGVEVDELHRPGERGDLVRDAQLEVAGPLRFLGQVDRVARQGDPMDRLHVTPGTNGLVGAYALTCGASRDLPSAPRSVGAAQLATRLSRMPSRRNRSAIGDPETWKAMARSMSWAVVT